MIPQNYSFIDQILFKPLSVSLSHTYTFFPFGIPDFLILSIDIIFLSIFFFFLVNEFKKILINGKLIKRDNLLHGLFIILLIFLLFYTPYTAINFDRPAQRSIDYYVTQDVPQLQLLIVKNLFKYYKYTLTPFIVIYILSIYLLCMEVYNKRIGILTILIIFSLNFYNQNYSNNIFLWKLMSVLPLVFLCYVKSNNFRKLRYSVLLAIALSYLLTSYFRAPIYLLTFFYYITKTAVEGKHQLVAKRNAMIVLMISFSLSFLWYFPQLNYLVRSFYYRFTTPVDEFILGEISGLKYHLYHINTLLPFFLGMFFPIFALILIWKLFTHKKKVERIMLMTVIISFIVFNVFPPKGDYFTPLFFISSIFLSDMIINSNRKIIKVISLIVIIILFLNSIVLRFEKFNDPGDLRVNLIGNNPKKVIEFINSDFRNTDKNLTLFIVNEHWSYSLSEFKYRLFINQDKHTLYYNYHLEPGYYENVTLQNRTIKGYSHETVNDSFSLIKDGVTDYVILSFLFDDRVYKNEAQKILSISDDILNSNLLLKYHLVKIINQDCMSFKKEYCQGYYIFKYNN